MTKYNNFEDFNFLKKYWKKYWNYKKFMTSSHMLGRQSVIAKKAHFIQFG